MLLVLGTRNAKKRGEIVDLLTMPEWQLADLTGWPNVGDVLENGETFEANARKKAAELAKKIGEWVLGEDSGLVVPALNGRPGVYSARFAGTHGDDAANNARLLSELAQTPNIDRGAFYVCVGALANPRGEIIAVVEGRCHGRIPHELRGGNGFGYDPLFQILEYHRTFGELSGRVKHALSHRARAMTQLRPILRKIAEPS